MLAPGSNEWLPACDAPPRLLSNPRTRPTGRILAGAPLGRRPPIRRLKGRVDLCGRGQAPQRGRTNATTEMPGSTFLMLALLVLLPGCGGARSSSGSGSRDWGEPIAVPLTPASLVQDTFLVVTDLWASPGPGPDTLLFHQDGSLTNRRAGLTGPWRVLNDTTLSIGTQVFRWRRQSGDLFDPIRADSAGEGALGWRIRRG